MPGPIRKPDSVRGIRENLQPLDAPETVSPPDWLPKDARAEFSDMVCRLTAANVPIKSLDVYAIAMASQCVSSVAKWTALEARAKKLTDKIECSKLVARYQRDSQQWLAAICATPSSRVRIGIKSPEKKTGKLAELLAMKKGHE